MFDLLAASPIDSALTGVFAHVLPEAILVGVACLVYLLGTFGRSAREINVVCIAGLAAALYPALKMTPDAIEMLTVSPLRADGLAAFVRLAAIVTGIVLVLISWNDSGQPGEYSASLLVAVAGFSLCGAANDLIVLFLALEMVSIPTYVMLAVPNQSMRSREASAKYFFLSIASSAMMLFGFSYLYGVAGTTNVTAIIKILPSALGGDQAFLGVMALVLIVAGLGFRITAFPFHFYAPDVYEGGPNGAVALLTFAPKLAGFAVFLRMFDWGQSVAAASPVFASRIMLLLWVLAAISMTAGNVLALWQNNLRRMLAYSSVSNAGYMLIGLAVMPTEGYVAQASERAVTGGEALLVYLIAYGAMTLGIFALLSVLPGPSGRVDTLDDLAGLRESRPFSAALMALFVFSLIGLPLTAGFAGKFLLFMSAIAAPAAAPLQTMYQVLAVVGAVNAAISAYYYLRILGAMYFRPAVPGLAVSRTPGSIVPGMLAASFCAALTVFIGVYPKPLMQESKAAIADSRISAAGIDQP